jgi:hypothetical protein
MSRPTAVFLDTSIFAGQQYNFESTALSTFIPAAKKRSVKFLLPDPTEREILRQIKERSEEALKALEDARRQAPFLAKWKHYPAKASPMVDWEVAKIANSEWNAFLANFDLVKLGYEGVKVDKVMAWYSSATPPFREGKKRKEFPDAFAVAILAEYAKKNDCPVAVVSADKDFKLACDRFSNLFYFESLPALTELLLTDDDRIEQLRKSILADASAIEASVLESDNFHFYHDDGELEVRDSSLLVATISNLRIVALGSGEATITFDADIEGEYKLEDSATGDDEWVSETFSIGCTAKVGIDLKSNKVTEIISIDHDQSITLREQPRSRQWMD